MPDKKKFNALTQIVQIRALEKTLAAQALSDAKLAEEEQLSNKEKAEKALLNAHKKWASHLSEGLMITEHLKYYADDLVMQMGQHKAAEGEYIQAVEETKVKTSSLQLCEAVVKKTTEIHSQLKRQLVQKDEERVLSAFEDRFAYLWSRKS